MAGQITSEQRRRFYQWHLRGKSYQEIADEEGVSKECMRYWCRRQRNRGDCLSCYQRTLVGLLSRFEPKVRFCVLHLRLEHPGWGSNRILLRLKKRSSLQGLRLPSESSIGRYLHQWERFRRRRKFEVVRERLRQAQRVHQRWQVDFKMEILLKDGSLVNLCTIRDPIGEACIGAFVFPAGRRKPGKRVTLEQLCSGICFLKKCRLIMKRYTWARLGTHSPVCSHW